MPALCVTYIIFTFILIFYGARVCPIVAGFGYLKALSVTIVPVALILPLRCLRYRQNITVLRDAAKRHLVDALPWREFRADLLSWVLIGVAVTLFYSIYLKAPVSTGVKIMLGCLSFGIFGGMLSLLGMEQRTIEKAETQKIEGAPGSKRFYSVSRKMLFFIITVLLFMVVAITLMIFMNINYLLTNRDIFGPDIYMDIFKEILFAFAVLFVLSLFIMGRYSRNLKRILARQVEALEQISSGSYDSFVPVVSNDEFGVIAAKTNEMIAGLKERDQCVLSFGKYVTPEVSEKILKGEISPDGELSRVTILFCDLRGYTSFVEKRDPKEVVSFLNLYFTEMEQAVRNCNGIVLQYIGDEIEAVFGAPIQELRHPDMALRAALEMRGRLEALNRRRIAAGEIPIQHGIGIHTGTVLAGSVGSPERLVYAMVGDAVNMAHRIQELNKQFKTDILISEDTKAALSDGGIRLENLGMAAVKGKTEKIAVYSVNPNVATSG